MSNMPASNPRHSEPSLAPLKQTIRKMCPKICTKIWSPSEYGYSHNSSPSLDFELYITSVLQNQYENYSDNDM